MRFFLSVKKCLHADITTIHCTCVQRFQKQHTKKGEKYNTLHRCKVSHRLNTIHYISAEVSHTVRYTTSVRRFPTLYDTHQCKGLYDIHQCWGLPQSTIHYISAEVSHTVRHATPVQRFPYCKIHYISAEVSHTVRYTLSVQYSERFPTDRNTMHCIRVRRFPYRYCTIHYISVVLFPHRYKYDLLHQRNFLQPAYDTLRQCWGFPQT